MNLIDEHDLFLKECKDARYLCRILLSINLQIEGIIETFDRFTITLRMKDTGELALYFKNAVVGILPVGLMELKR